MNEPAFVYRNPVQMLSVSNFALFVLVVYAYVWAGIGLLRRACWRQMLFAFVATFYLLEVARWIEAVWRLSKLTVYGGLFLDPITYLGIAVLLSPLALAYYVTRSTFQEPAT